MKTNGDNMVFRLKYLLIGYFGMRSPFRCVSGQAGFSLIELLVVIALMTTLSAIAVFSFNSWQRKSNVEKQTIELQSGLTNLRMLSITKKMTHRAFLDAGRYRFKQYTSAAEPVDGNAASSTIADIPVTYPIQIGTFGTAAANQTIVFDERGYLLGVSQVTVIVGPQDINAYTNCFVVSRARINLGKMDNAGTCTFK